MIKKTKTSLAAGALVAASCGAAIVAGTLPTTTPARADGSAATPARADAAATRSAPAFSALERRYGARLGVVAVDTQTNRAVTYRPDERFAFASTSKVLTAGVALKQASDAELDRVLRWTKDQVLEYAPITDDFVSSGLSLRHLLNAMLSWSDNTAMNVAMRSQGGPRAVERALRRLGDTTSNIDRFEPDLNTAVPGDVRDTSTPRAMAANLRRLVVGNALTPPRRELLRDLLLTNTTGDALIRAGVPKGWRVADKTGSASYGTRNDIAVVYPPGRKPYVVAVFSTRRTQDAKPSEAIVAGATRVALRALRGTS